MLKKNNTLTYTTIYTIVLIFLLSAVFLSMINNVYISAESEAEELLHMQTKEIKDDINLQIKSDNENLITMASLASKLYLRKKSYDVLFDAFESIGLIESIAILLPDETLITKKGEISLKGKISYSDEVQKGSYVSGKVPDLTIRDTYIIRSCVPIIANGETIALLYGRIDISDMQKKYKSYADGYDAYLWVVDRTTGDFILDTLNDTPKDITCVNDAEYKDGYSYEKLYNDIAQSASGFATFKPTQTNEYLYAHYSDLNVSDWHIVLMRPECKVFAAANSTRSNLFKLFVLVISIMTAYIILLLNRERKISKLHYNASLIRKLLLETTQNPDIINVALENITVLTKASTAFFVDTDGENYNLISSREIDHIVSDTNRDRLISLLTEYAENEQTDPTVTSMIFKVTLKTAEKNGVTELADLMREHSINTLCIAIITSKKNKASIVGIVNPKKTQTALSILREIAICFSMSVANKKYLVKTETIAVTDSLTGLFNRMAFKKDIAEFNDDMPQDLSCIYIDIDGLHIFNNKFGHNAGDGMLLYIAKATKENFDQSKVYRMGGDEYVVLTTGMTTNELNKRIEKLKQRVEEANYHISLGLSFATDSSNANALVEEAEKKMYEEKARYYQEKDLKTLSDDETTSRTTHIDTGIQDLNEALNIMSKHYQGIYCVSLEEDKARRILTPNYLNLDDNSSFKSAFTQYMNNLIHPDYHRALTTFVNFDVLKNQLKQGLAPGITYEKINGEKIHLSIHGFSDYDENNGETVWLFERV